MSDWNVDYIIIKDNDREIDGYVRASWLWYGVPATEHVFEIDGVPCMNFSKTQKIVIAQTSASVFSDYFDVGDKIEVIECYKDEEEVAIIENLKVASFSPFVLEAEDIYYIKEGAATGKFKKSSMKDYIWKEENGSK